MSADNDMIQSALSSLVHTTDKCLVLSCWWCGLGINDTTQSTYQDSVSVLSGSVAAAAAGQSLHLSAVSADRRLYDHWALGLADRLLTGTVSWLQQLTAAV